MIGFKRFLSVLLCGSVIGVSAANLFSVKNWRPFPKAVTCSKDGNAIRFDSGNREKQMFPLCNIPAGAFKKVRALRFDIRYRCQNPSDKFISAVLLYSKSQKKNIHFYFKVDEPDTWQTVTVELNHPDVDMAKLRYWQFSFISRNPDLVVQVKNLKCLYGAGDPSDQDGQDSQDGDAPAAGLLSAKNWRPFPEGIRCTNEDGAVKFDSTDSEKQMFPLCNIPEGSFGKVRALRFDIKYRCQDPSGKLISAVLLYSKSQKKNIHFNFKVKLPDVWQTVTVNLDHPDVDMAKLRYWQFSFASRNPNLIVMVKNLQLLETAVKESAPPVRKKANNNAQGVNLLSAKNWRAFPEGISCTNEGGAVKFDSADSEKQMFPLCNIPEGAFGKVRSLRFDIKYRCQDPSAKLISSVLLYSKSRKKNIRFPFTVKSPDVWQTVTVDLKHPDVDMAELRYWQFSFANRNPNLVVMVKNFRCLNEAGEVIASLSRNESEIRKPALAPVGAPDSFAALPNAAHEYLFSAGELKDGQKIGWRITDVSGEKTVSQGTSAVKDRQWKVCATLPAGFYELHADETDQIFGISVLNPPRSGSDLFFSIEALLYTTPAESQESCLRFLEKHHINCIRDWTSFHQLHPAPGVYRNRRDTLFRRMAEHHIQSIYAFSNFPSWQKPIAIRKNPCALPRTLLGLDTALLTMYDQRRASAVMFQTLNEFDTFAIPSECFMAPIRAAAWAMRDHPECLLGGAAFCTPAETPAFNGSMENHLLDYIDVFSLHIYRAPEEALERVEGYRKAMRKHPRKAWMPIWITESGKPWERGRDSKDGRTYSAVVNNQHPQVEEDLQSALWITANAVEAKTMGIERFFPFTMAFFQENNSNFGMMDYHRTPLRSLHCYCFAADLLAGKEYAGDPAAPSRTLKAEHVFCGKDESVVVFYAGKDSHKLPYCEADVSRFPAGKGFSMTGAELESKDGILRFQGGLAYWVFPTAKLDMKSLNTATRNMALLQGAKSYRKIPRVCSPVIPRYKFWQSKTPHYNQFVHFLEGEKCVFQLTNLDSKEQEFRPALTLPEGVSLRKALPEKIVLPPRSEQDLVLEIDPGKADSFTVRLADSRDPLSSVTVPLVAVGNLRAVAVDCIEKPGRWRPNSAGTQQITYDKTRNALKVYTDFRKKKDPEASHWSYPELNLSDSEKSSNLVAVSFDLMIDPACYNVNAQKWHMLQAGSKQSGADYFPCIGVSDQWKSFTVYISGKEPRTLIRIGMATEAQDLTYYIRNVKFHYGN